MIKKIATFFIVALMVSVFLLDIATVVVLNHSNQKYPVTQELFSGSGALDRIHFLAAGNSDCILLESNGRFALIDAGNGSNNPRGKKGGIGYEQVVIDYLKKVAGDENGKVTLDFILPTHIHYDHMGGFEQIIRNGDITIEKAYIKPFRPEIDKGYELEFWGIDEIYNRTLSALRDRNVPVISDLPSQPFSFGDFTVQFFNTVTDDSMKGAGENANSIGTKIIKNGHSAFLTGDLSNTRKQETELAPLIGQVDLLKLGHHGYVFASSSAFIRAMRPKIAIATNHVGKIYPNVKWNLTMIAHAAVYGSASSNGVIATFPDDGEIQLTDNIH